MNQANDFASVYCSSIRMLISIFEQQWYANKNRCMIGNEVIVGKKIIGGSWGSRIEEYFTINRLPEAGTFFKI